MKPVQEANRPLASQSLVNESRLGRFGAIQKLNRPGVSPSVADRWSAALSQNHMLSRVFVEFFGYTLWNVALGRNGWERFERLMDSVAWALLGLGLPIVASRAMVPMLNRQLVRQFPKAFAATKSMAIKPLAVPFQWLDSSRFVTHPSIKSLTPKQLKPFGLLQLPKGLADKILMRKLFAIMMVDYLALWAKANLYAFGKNWFTAKFSKKEGFSGVFNLANEDYRKAQTSTYEKNKKRNMAISMGLGFLGSISMPFILLAALKSPVKPGAKGLTGWFKNKVPWLNYSNTVFMSKYALLWQVFWNWNLAGFMAARDDNERREHLAKCFASDFFFFIGDDFISGYTAKALQASFKDRLKGIPLIHKKRGLFGNIEARSFGELMRVAQQVNDPAQRRLIQNLSRTIFASGIVGTALCLGISFTAVTQWYTRRKLQQEGATKNNALDSASKSPVQLLQRAARPTQRLTPTLQTL